MDGVRSSKSSDGYCQLIASKARDCSFDRRYFARVDSKFSQPRQRFLDINDVSRDHLLIPPDFDIEKPRQLRRTQRRPFVIATILISSHLIKISPVSCKLRNNQCDMA